MKHQKRATIVLFSALTGCLGVYLLVCYSATFSFGPEHLEVNYQWVFPFFSFLAILSVWRRRPCLVRWSVSPNSHIYHEPFKLINSHPLPTENLHIELWEFPHFGGGPIFGALPSFLSQCQLSHYWHYSEEQSEDAILKTGISLDYWPGRFHASFPVWTPKLETLSPDSHLSTPISDCVPTPDNNSSNYYWPRYC